MRESVKAILAAALALLLMVFNGCGTPTVDAINPGEYDNTDEEEWVGALPLYIAWDGAGGESWEYECSAEGVVEEGVMPDQHENEEELVIDGEYDAPGGRTVWFYGISPGDVVITFTTKSSGGKVVDIQQYAIRVFNNLQLTLLHSQNDNFRD